MSRLSNATMAAVPVAVTRPRYDRSGVSPGIVHFGPGAFHRAHQAPAFDSLLARDPRWGITAVSLNSAAVAEALNPQDGLYALALLDREPELRVIGSIGRVLTTADPAAILGALASPQTLLTSLTVTEKGYCLAGDGTLDVDHPDIRRDLATETPKSAIGWLYAGLAARRAAGLPGLTVLSCDNLSSNGAKLRAAVLDFAEQKDRDAALWIADKVKFPNAMVDSITPATDDAVRARVGDGLGLLDAWPVQRERFTQWVIEDDFAGERPELECAGVTFTADVHGFEAAKLRLLNGSHSTLAYVGLGLGYGSVAEAMRDSRLAAFVAQLMRGDIAPLLQAPRGLDLGAYIDAILQRFENPAIEHRLSQIAWDGSQKLPYRILDSVRDAMRAGRPIERLCVPVAAWIRFLERAALRGEAITDPLAARLLASAHDWRAILAMPAVFGELGREALFVETVARVLARSAEGQLEAGLA